MANSPHVGKSLMIARYPAYQTSEDAKKAWRNVVVLFREKQRRYIAYEEVVDAVNWDGEGADRVRRFINQKLLGVKR